MAPSVDPFALPDGYVLDVLPSANEAVIPRQLRGGDRILTARDGRGYVWERSPGTLRRYLVRAVLGKHWASPPCRDGPLFGEPTDGTLHLRGSGALRRFEATRSTKGRTFMPRTRASEDEPKAQPLEPQATNGNGMDEAPIPSPGAGDELDEFARYAVQDVVTAQAGEAVTCAVGPPNKLHFFRIHQDPCLYRVLHFLVVEIDNKKRTYLVNGALVGLPEFEGRTKVAQTAPWINEHGGLGIWLPSIQHDENSWVRSALILIEEAKTRWVAAIPVKKVGAYTLLPSKRDRGEPEWPALSFSHWMKLAFPQDMRIDDRGHPIAKMLRGE